MQGTLLILNQLELLTVNIDNTQKVFFLEETMTLDYIDHDWNLSYLYNKSYGG